MKSRKHITVDFLPFILLFHSLFFCLINWNNIVDLSVICFAICKLIKPCLIKTALLLLGYFRHRILMVIYQIRPSRPLMFFLRHRLQKMPL